MNNIEKEIFRAIHEGKWLSIEYKNKKEKITRYWIGIRVMEVQWKGLLVDGLHLGKMEVRRFRIRIEGILSAKMIDGSYCEINHKLVEDIRDNPHKYQTIFTHTANLKVLNYLADCSKLDTTPYKSEYALISQLDREKLTGGACQLTPGQFQEIVKDFQLKCDRNTRKINQLAMNVMSIHTKSGLYVLAYRRLYLDVASRTLKPQDDITICTEFTIQGIKESIRKYLDADDYELLKEFEKNQELIKDKITRHNRWIRGVDDMPYLISIGFDVNLDLNKEYAGIIKMYQEDRVTVPVQAFFGDLIRRPGRRKEYPLALMNQKVNLDQLLAINNGVKYPLTYIQGPPGTGKTNTINNLIVTAFFNEKTVLFASYNNHPIDSVCDTLSKMTYRGRQIPFPMIRLGNNEKTKQALRSIRRIYQQTQEVKIYDTTLKRNKGDKIEGTKRLTELLKRYEEILELRERKETMEKLLESSQPGSFQWDLQGRQLREVEEKQRQAGSITDEEALSLLTKDEEAFEKYLYYTSAKYIKRLDEPKNQELLEILYLEDEENRLSEFNKYLSKGENFKKFLRIFPVVATTCISAHKLGAPEPYFDMAVIDEASQCNTAVSLVPIIRGENLVLVGDPQQLSPVILLSSKDNEYLRQKYEVAKEYDYSANSIYKTFLACDAVSDEILLSHHYRCHKKIIEFNNKKYYNQKLQIDSKSKEEHPLVFVDVKNDTAYSKNTAPGEAMEIVNYVRKNPDKRIGIITPFTSQKELINQELKQNGMENVTCGTVHAFQGDEKDVILFSMAVTPQTHVSTYNWLKNNKELLNVATSRARDQLILIANASSLERLHQQEEDDLYELAAYVKSNGESKVSAKTAASRALGIKPYSTETEEAFLQNLNHALDNIMYYDKKCVIHKEVAIAHVFQENETYNDLFYSGRFDFVVYERTYGRQELPLLAIELDGKEHREDSAVKKRDQKKNEICRQHGFDLIRVENSYARRYNFVKDILMRYFKVMG